MWQDVSVTPSGRFLNSYLFGRGLVVLWWHIVQDVKHCAGLGLHLHEIVSKQRSSCHAPQVHRLGWNSSATTGASNESQTPWPHWKVSLSPLVSAMLPVFVRAKSNRSSYWQRSRWSKWIIIISIILPLVPKILRSKQVKLTYYYYYYYYVFPYHY